MMLVIFGPTVTGKTDLAINVARSYKAEVISADSRQIYRHLDIGSGKASPGAKVIKKNGYWIVNRIKINGFDISDPLKNFSSADFSRYTYKVITKLEKSAKMPILVGGSGFYIKSALFGFDTFGIPGNEKLRKELNSLSVEALYKELLSLDSKRALALNSSDRKNPRRLIRSIEVATSKSSTRANLVKPDKNSKKLIVCLTAPNDFLYKRADEWLDIRLTLGMIAEVKSLLEKYNNPEWFDSLGLEYRWLTRYILGKIPKKEALTNLRGDIHDLIRRQKTFINQFPQALIFDITKKDFKKEFENSLHLWYTQKNGK
ncbi:MAG: isopentenyl transferase family protein [Patescibacteria group bacterium]